MRTKMLLSTCFLNRIYVGILTCTLLSISINVSAEKSENSAKLYAQSSQSNKSVTGTVLDESGEPIIGATVLQKGTTNGISTDLDGNFSLTLPQGSTLVISYIGYVSQEFVIGSQTTFKVTLKEDSKTLEEVVIVGFGAQKKENLTGSVSQVKMDEVLGSRPVTSVMGALQGAMPGLQITANNDASGPGQSKSFNIRGTTSINGGGPLVLIDNVPGDIDMLNPEDIESVSVLKDAASTAIYGARAAFGVILVTTKKAKKGDQIRINYNNNFGFQHSINRPEQADGLQWMQAYLDGEFNAGNYYTGQSITKWMELLKAYRENPSQFVTTGDGVYKDPESGLNYYLNEKNLYTNMFDNYGFLQSHNASVSGSSEKITYRMSIGYNDEQGILITDKDRFSRVSTSGYVSSEITPWLTQSIDFRYAQSEKNMPVTSDKTGLYDMKLPVIYPEGTLTLPDGRELMTNTPSNLLRMATDNNRVNDNMRMMSKTVVKPLSGLDIAFEYTYDKKVNDHRVNRAMTDYTTVELATIQTFNNSSLATTKSSTDYNAINLYATYKKSWNDAHNMSVMAGFNQELSDYKEVYSYSYDMINDEYPSHNTATGASRVITEKHNVYSVRGAFYRVNYDYKGRYLFEANGRYDGSSKFPTKNRFGFFPSFSLGWNIARENFMSGLADRGLSELKLRASWGQIGNQAIDPYKFVASMNQMGKNDVPWLENGLKPITLTPPGLISNTFTWETVETLDFGFDFALANSRLRGTFDWYQRDTKDMLAPGLELPAVVGAAAPLQNTADLRTKGWELNLTWRDKVGELGYTIGMNLFDSQTEVTKYNNKSKVILKSDGTNNYYEGYKMGTIWGYETDGFYTVDDFEDTKTWKLKEGVVSPQGVSPRPGDIKYKNLRDSDGKTNIIDEGDGTLANPGDRKVIGNSSLRFQYGVNLGLDYKGLNLSVMLQGVGKRDVWISDARRWPMEAGQFGTLFSDQLNYWKPVDAANGDWRAENANPEFFRIYGQRNNAGYNTRRQTKYLLDGSYLRVKNITLGYTFPTALVSRVSLSGLKVFLSCENLHTFHNLPKGYDPERLSWGYPFYRTLSFGLNVTL